MYLGSEVLREDKPETQICTIYIKKKESLSKELDIFSQSMYYYMRGTTD